MVQGTCSNAGKSILAAAFCRIFLQDGLRVAPFKAQNMALNSCVTPDGLEMGRAQAVQAAACRLDPDVRMNPVLLKPCSDVGSQVIVMGRPVGVMRVRQYVDYKPQARDAAFAAYDSLAAEHDVMVIEGAGSPAEINLKAHDIVNMAMARHAGARVLLVGDIDRGGVFAALVGTMELLEDWERNHVAGYLLNKFRGDASLLDPALEFMKERTGRPVLGVVPYLRDLGLPEEDSVTFKEGLPGLRGGVAAEGGGDTLDSVPGILPDILLDIVLVDLPHISNFTDVDALRGEPDVRLRVARTPADLPAPDGRMPDAVILPGSKNTTGDLRTLRATGMADALAQLARDPDGPVVAGICAGLQMLGLRVADPLGLEGGGTEQGLGLLPVRTELAAEKTLRRTAGVHPRSGLPVMGYEIRHGITVEAEEGEGGGTGQGRRVALDEGRDTPDGPASPGAAFPFLLRDDGGPLGWGTHGGRVWGTSLHGVFDGDGFRRHFLDGLRARRGLAPLGRVVAPYSLDPALDRLADAVRAAVDMDAIYDMLHLRPGRV